MKQLWRIILLSCLLYAPAYNAQADAFDISSWAQVFAGAAATGNVDEMMAIMERAKDPALDLSLIKPLLVKFTDSVADELSLYTEQIDDETVGTVYHRVTVAVIYKSKPRFYKITFMREDVWRLIGFSFDGNYNKIKKIGW